jgi:hypothetical protein
MSIRPSFEELDGIKARAKAPVRTSGAGRIFGLPRG